MFDFAYDPQGNVVQRQTAGDYAAGAAAFDETFFDETFYEGYGALRQDYSVRAGGGTPAHHDPAGFGGQYGYYTDVETGLLLLGHRYYDPGTGKFLNRDPIGYQGGANLYAFCGGNPVNESDPEGTDPPGGPDPTAYFNTLFSYATPRDVLNILAHNDVTRAVRAFINGASYIPLPENPAADARAAEVVVEGSNIVYRALKDSEIAEVAAGKGILTRPNGGTTMTQHVMGANSATTPFLSLTRSLETARFFAAHNPDGSLRAVANPIVAIDLSKVTAPVHDLSSPNLASVLKHPMARNFAAKHRELLLGNVRAGGHLNPNAIIGYVK